MRTVFGKRKQKIQNIYEIYNITTMCNISAVIWSGNLGTHIENSEQTATTDCQGYMERTILGITLKDKE